MPCAVFRCALDRVVALTHTSTVADRLEHRPRPRTPRTQEPRFVGRLPKYNTSRREYGGRVPCVRVFNRPGASRGETRG